MNRGFNGKRKRIFLKTLAILINIWYDIKAFKIRKDINFVFARVYASKMTLNRAVRCRIGFI